DDLLEDRLVPNATEPEGTAPVRQLWDIDDPKELRYAIHDLAKRLRDKHRQIWDNPDKWMHRVRQDLQHRGVTPDRAQALLTLIDSQAFKEKLEGHSGLVVSALRKLAAKEDFASKRSMKSQNIRNDADVYEQIIKPSLNWFIEEIENDP